VCGLYILALIIGTGVNLHNMHTSDPIFRTIPCAVILFSPAWVAGVITSWRLFSVFILTLGYVYRDASDAA